MSRLVLFVHSGSGCLAGWLLFTLTLNGTSPAFAQMEKRELLRHKLHVIITRGAEYEKIVGRWETVFHVLAGIVIAVIVMGAVVAILQFSKREWKKECFILGVLIGALTGFSSTYFPADHRAHDFSAQKARDELSAIKALVTGKLELLSDNDLEELVNDGLQSVKRLGEIKDNLNRAWTPSQATVPATKPGESKGRVLSWGLFTPFARIAFAAQETLQPQSFVGVGQAPTVGDARAIAHTLAATKASEALAKAWTSPNLANRPDAYMVRSFIAQIADVRDQVVPESDSVFRCTTTVVIPSEFLRQSWSPAFGVTPPTPLLSSQRVIVRVAAAVPERSVRPEGESWGLDNASLKIVSPERSAVFVIIRGDGSDTGPIVDGGVVTFTTADGALSRGPKKDLSVQRASQANFRLQRLGGSKDLGDGLRDGDIVEITLDREPVTIVDERVTPTKNGLSVSWRIVRAARIP